MNLRLATGKMSPRSLRHFTIAPRPWLASPGFNNNDARSNRLLAIPRDLDWLSGGRRRSKLVWPLSKRRPRARLLFPTLAILLVACRSALPALVAVAGKRCHL